MNRGEIWWADFGEPRGSAPAQRRPVVIVQANAYNKSSIRTVIVCTITSNQRLGGAPGNVFLKKSKSGLREDSVVNVSAVSTIDRNVLTDYCGTVTAMQLRLVDDGLRMVLGL